MDGAISFDGAVEYNLEVSNFSTSEYPNALVAPFWTDIDTRLAGTVYYRWDTNWYTISQSIIPPSLIRNTSDVSLMQSFREEVGNYFPGFPNYQPAVMVIATWDNVGHYNSSTDSTNTFQAVLATDGISSFVMFLYSKIGWTMPDSKPPANYSVQYVHMCIFSIHGSHAASYGLVHV